MPWRPRWSAGVTGLDSKHEDITAPRLVQDVGVILSNLLLALVCNALLKTFPLSAYVDIYIWASLYVLGEDLMQLTSKTRKKLLLVN